MQAYPFVVRLGSLVVALFCAVLLTGCETTLKVRSDISPSADFSRYRTYGFFKPMGIEGGYNSPVYGESFRAAIAREMESRGYRSADTPDLIINVTSRIDDEVRMTTYTTPYMSGMYYDRPGGAYYGSGVGVGAGVSTRATRTEVVSIFIDLVDNAADSIAWQGVAVATLDDGPVKELQAAVDKAVGQVFELYPHQAGQ